MWSCRSTPLNTLPPNPNPIPRPHPLHTSPLPIHMNSHPYTPHTRKTDHLAIYMMNWLEFILLNTRCYLFPYTACNNNGFIVNGVCECTQQQDWFGGQCQYSKCSCHFLFCFHVAYRIYFGFKTFKYFLKILQAFLRITGSVLAAFVLM